MNEWLPGDFQEGEMVRRAEAALGAVRNRASRRARTVRITTWAAAAILLLAAGSLLVPRLDQQVTPHRMASNAPAPRSTQTVAAPSPTFSLLPHPVGVPKPSVRTSPARPAPEGPAPDISLTKKEGGIELQWKGSPGQEYVIYRCTSPRFDACARVGIVRGTTWTDTSASSAPILFYRVEPRTGA